VSYATPTTDGAWINGVVNRTPIRWFVRFAGAEVTHPRLPEIGEAVQLPYCLV